MIRWLFLLLVFSYALAFQVPSHRTRHSVGTVAVPPTENNVPLFLFNKKNPPPEEPKKQEWGLDLFLVYMTPWRNPNSIFVYMFLALYVLGTISEARSAAGQ